MSENSKKFAWVKPIAVKEFEQKMIQNSASVSQGELVFDIEVEREINGVQMGVLTNGTPYLTQTGLAKMCGIPRKTIYDIEQEFNDTNPNKKVLRIKEWLTNQGYSEKSLFIKVHQGKNIYNAYPDNICMALLEYFAFEDSKSRKEAVDNYRLLVRTSFRVYIYNSTGYIQQTQRLNEWKYFLDRVDINYDTVPVNYFSIFKEIAGLTVSLIKNKVIIDDRTILDISVGLTWGNVWIKNNLDELYGNRIKYEHNYPNYYPQSVSNPQEPWDYPNDALPFFRKWFQYELF